MKVKLSGTIQSFDRDTETGTTRLTILCTKGKVAAVGPSAQDAMLMATLSVKTLVANQMKIGSNITFTISDEEPDEGLT